MWRGEAVYFSDVVHIGKVVNNIEGEPLKGGNIQGFRNRKK
jgi:hypothetical protein